MIARVLPALILLLAPGLAGAQNPILPDPNYPKTYITRIPARNEGCTAPDCAPGPAAHNLYFYRPLWNVDRSYMLIDHEGPGLNNTISLHDGLGNWIKDLYTADVYDWRVAWSQTRPNILYSWKNPYTFGVNQLVVIDVNTKAVIQTFDTAPLSLTPSSVGLTPSGPTTSATRVYFSQNQTPTNNISAATNNGAGLVRLTVAGHGLINGETVQVDNVGGTTEANGTWIVTVIDANTIDLRGSTYAKAYQGGGRVAWIYRHFSYGLNFDGTINTADGRSWSSRYPESWRRGVSKDSDNGKIRKVDYGGFYWEAGSQENYSGPLGASSDSTHLVLGAGASALDDVYTGNTLYEGHNPFVEFTITAYNGATKTATITPAAASTPGGPITMSSGVIIVYEDINVAVTGAVAGVGGVVRLAAPGHGLNTGETVTVKGVAGTTEANGVWDITRVDGNTLELQGSAFAHAYAGGGALTGRIASKQRGLGAGHASVTPGGKILTGEVGLSYKPFSVTARDLVTGANKITVYSSTKGGAVQEMHVSTASGNPNRAFVGPFPSVGLYPYPGTYVPNVGGAWNSPASEANAYVPYDELIMLSTNDNWATQAGVTVRYIARSLTHGSGSGSPFSFWCEMLPTSDPLGQRVEIQSLRTNLIEPWIVFPDGPPTPPPSSPTNFQLTRLLWRLPSLLSPLTAYGWRELSDSGPSTPSPRPLHVGPTNTAVK